MIRWSVRSIVMYFISWLDCLLWHFLTLSDRRYAVRTSRLWSFIRHNWTLQLHTQSCWRYRCLPPAAVTRKKIRDGHDCCHLKNVNKNVCRFSERRTESYADRVVAWYPLVSHLQYHGCWGVTGRQMDRQQTNAFCHFPLDAQGLTNLRPYVG